MIQQDGLVSNADESLFVGRVTRNVFDESELGFIATAGDPNTESGNRLHGVDYTYRNSQFFGDQSVRANVWYQQTETNRFQ